MPHPDTTGRHPRTSRSRTGPIHLDATPSHRRGLDLPRPVTMWATSNGVVTVPGHRDLSHTQPLNLVNAPPAYVHQTQVVVGNERHVGTTVPAGLRSHGSRRLWEQAQDDAVIAQAVHLPQRRGRPNEIQIRARARSATTTKISTIHSDATTTPPTSYRGDSVISSPPSSCIRHSRSTSTPLLSPRPSQTLMSQHDHLNRSPTVRPSLNRVDWAPDNSRGSSIPHVRQWRQRRGEDVPTPPPNPDMEPAWRYQQFYDAPVSTQRRPREVRARSVMVQDRCPTATVELLARPPMPMTREDRVERASLRSATSTISRRVGSFLRGRARGLSEATGLERVYRTSKFQEHLDEETLRAASIRTPAHPHPAPFEEDDDQTRLQKPSPVFSLTHLRNLLRPSFHPSPPQSFSHAPSHRTTETSSRSRSSTNPILTPRPPPARYQPRPVSAGPSTLPAINEEDFRVRPFPPSTTSTSSTVLRHNMPFVPYTGNGKARARPEDFRPLRQYSASQAQWTAEMAGRSFETGIDCAVEAEVERQAVGARGVTDGGRQSWPFPDPMPPPAATVQDAASKAEVPNPDSSSWVAEAISERQKRVDAERRYEARGEVQRLRVANCVAAEEEEEEGTNVAEEEEEEEEEEVDKAAEDADDESSSEGEGIREEGAAPERKDTLGGEVACGK